MKTFIVRINTCIITKCYQKTWQWVHPRFLVWFVLLDLLLYVYDCRSLLVLFLLAIVLSVLLFANSEYPFGIFKLFLAATAFHTLSMNIILIMALQTVIPKMVINHVLVDIYTPLVCVMLQHNKITISQKQITLLVTINYNTIIC